MATVDEILAQAQLLIGDETYTTDTSYPVYTIYADPEYIQITNKQIPDFSGQISVKGEENSQFIGFQILRHEDGIDLTNMRLYIHYQTGAGGGDSMPCNVSISDQHIRLHWLVPATAVQNAETIQFMIYVAGHNEKGEPYKWKTLPANYTVRGGLDIGGGIPEPDQSWYEQFLWQMDQKISQAQGHSDTAKGYADHAKDSKDASVQSASEAAASARAAVNTLTSAKTEITAATATAKDEIDQKAADTLATIPEDYTQIDTDVKALKKDAARYSARFSNALIGTKAGTGSVLINDAWDAKIMNLEIDGNSKQSQYTGHNLFDPNLPYIANYASYTISNSEGNDLRVNGKPNKAFTGIEFNLLDKLAVEETYTLSIESISQTNHSSKAACVINIISASGNQSFVADNSTKSVTFRIADYQKVSKCTLTMYTNYSNDLNLSYNTAIFFDLMLVKGNAKLPWEPYTGGKPSPSPEFQKGIKNIGDNNSVDVAVSGENLFDRNQLSVSPVSSTLIFPDEKTIKIDGTNPNMMAEMNLDASFIVGKKVCVSFESETGCIEFMEITGNSGFITRCYPPKEVIEVSENVDLVRITLYLKNKENIDGSTISNTYINLMINYGDNALPWKPYCSQPLSIPLTEPLCGIGDTKDRITGTKRINNCKQLIFDGSEDEIWDGVAANNNNRFRMTLTDVTNSSTDYNVKFGLCNQFVWNRNVALDTNNEQGFIVIGNKLYIRFGAESEVNSLEKLKTYLASSPLICVFPLYAPTEQDLPTETAEALQALHTYSGQTNISAIADGLMPDLTVDYVQNIQKVITDLQAEIAALKNNVTT